MNIVSTIKTATPQKTALFFSTILAADKGYSSTIKNDGEARIVIASDGKAVRFEP